MAEGTWNDDSPNKNRVVLSAQGDKATGSFRIKYIHYYDPVAVAGTSRFVLDDVKLNVPIAQDIALAGETVVSKILPGPDAEVTDPVLTTLVGDGTVTLVLQNKRLGEAILA